MVGPHCIGPPFTVFAGKLFVSQNCTEQKKCGNEQKHSLSLRKGTIEKSRSF